MPNRTISRHVSRPESGAGTVMTGTPRTLVSVYESIADLPTEVTAFVSNRAGDQLWHGPQWFELLARFGVDASQKPRVYVLHLRTQAEIDAVLYCATESASTKNRVRKLRSLANFYTMSYAPLIRVRDESAAADILGALARTIARELPAWDVVELQCLAEDAVTAALAAAFRAQGMLVDTYFQAENWFRPTAGISAQQYFENLPSQVRNTVTRKTKRARKEHDLEIRILSSPEDMAKGLEDYQTIYARSWKEPEMHPEFIPQLLRHTARLGQLRLGVLRLDGEPAAAQIWFVLGGQATIYKLAYDEKFASLSVGSILTKAMFDHAIDRDGVREVDYGRGSEGYKRDWMTERRNLVGMIAFNPRTPRGLLAAGRHFVGRWTKPLRAARDVGRSGSAGQHRRPDPGSEESTRERP